MQDLYKVMTREQAIAQFEEAILPEIQKTEQEQGFSRDLPLRRESWNNYTDGLCKDGMISDWQYENWTQPGHICGY
tara:strand:- start:510 stop:737 length:228 start_codon:yes stop_codon:yes gene_type:complete